MNRVEIIGRLTRDPDIYYTRNDKNLCVAKFTLAVNRYRGGENLVTDFLPFVSFDKKAEFVQKYLKQGMKVAVVGRLESRIYTNKEGRRNSIIEVFVEEIEFCEPKSFNKEEKPDRKNDVSEYMPEAEVENDGNYYNSVSDSIPQLPEEAFEGLPFA